MPPTSAAHLARLGSDGFRDALAGVVEHSPWVAERAWERRPFATREEVHLALEAAIRTAPREQRVELLRAHPELAGGEALTPASAGEQRAARLDRLTPDERDRLRELNAAYRDRFGFPFISCVGEHSVASLLAWGAARLHRDPEAEEATAIAEVGKIVGLRLKELVR